MDTRLASLLILTTALGVNAYAENSSPLPPHAAAQISTLPADDTALLVKKPLPKAAPVALGEEPGTVFIAPPIVRNTGTTVLTPERPLLGRLNLQGPWPRELLREQPPPGDSGDATLSMGADNTVAPGQARD